MRVVDRDCPPGGLPACLRHPQWLGHPWACVSLTKVAGPWAGHSVKDVCDHEHVLCARPPALGYDHQKLTEKLRSRART